MKEIKTIAIKIEVDDIELQKTKDEIDVLNIKLDEAIAKLKEIMRLEGIVHKPDRRRRLSWDAAFSDNSDAIENFGQNYETDYR